MTIFPILARWLPVATLRRAAPQATFSLECRPWRLALGSSLLVHVALLVLLALLRVSIPARRPPIFSEPLWLTAVHALPPEPLETLAIPPTPLAGSPRLPALEWSPARTPADLPELALDPGAGASPAVVPPAAARTATALPARTVQQAPAGGGMPGPPQPTRTPHVTATAGTPEGEALIRRGLAWLVAHQNPDGSWHFRHTAGPCQGRCRHAGYEPSTTAATGLALLGLLGGGQTPHAGPHQQAVRRGLDYLRQRMVRTPRGGDLSDGTMYGQGLATLALCEAAGMTGDRELGALAQEAIRFIVAAQHPAGGWRYFPGQAGDTTVLGWQWMALRSGELAGLTVPPSTWQRASHFLDGVAAEGGAAYGYQRPGRQPTPTAIGLTCRLYGEWSRQDPRIVQGAEGLAATGPSFDDQYYNYYAAQVLHHSDSPHWPAFRALLRDRLAATQARSGHEAGSWYFPDQHTEAGGRLCDTALALLILELDYRQLPLFGLRSTAP